MLQSIRDRTQGWVASIIISLVILSFALWGIHSYLEGGGASTYVAKVNGVQISKRELASAYDRMRRQAQASLGSVAIPESIQTVLKRKALDMLISMQVLQQASWAEKFRVSSSQIDSYLESMPDFQVDGRFSLTRFNQLLASSLYNAGDFLDLIKISLLIDQPRIGLQFSSFALPNEVDTTIALVNQERNIIYLDMPQTYFDKQVVAISPAEIKSYYKQHEAMFQTPEQVTIDYVTLSAKALMSTLQVNDDSLQSYYTENIASFTLPAEWKLAKIEIPVLNPADPKALEAAQSKADDISARLKKGEDFAKLAAPYAIPAAKDTQSAWVSLNQVSKELQKTVSSLTSKEQTSNPVLVDNHFEIVKVIDYKPAKQQSFAEASAEVKDALLHQRAQERFAELKEKIANLAYETPDSLEPIAKALNLKIESTDAFSRAKPGVNPVTAHQKVRDAAFSDDVLNSQNNSDVLVLTPDEVIVLRVKKHDRATLLPLKTVSAQIEQKLQAAKRAETSANLASTLRNKLQNGESFDQVRAEYPEFKLNALNWMGRYAAKVDSSILDAAFRIPKPATNANKFFITAKTPSGYAIVTVIGVKDGVVKDKAQRDAFVQQIQNSQAALEYQIYEESLKKQAKIVITNASGSTDSN